MSSKSITRSDGTGCLSLVYTMQTAEAKSMRKFLPVLLVLVFALVLAQVAQAKGPSDMISVSGHGLEFSTTRADLVLDLSLGSFEASCREPVGDTTLLPEGYDIRRYYQIDDGSFHQHDSFTYYPREGQQGVIYSTHFMPEHWLCASERGEQAFQRLLAEAAAQPYLLLAQPDGMLHVTDPESLVQIAEIDLFAAFPANIRPMSGGQALRYQTLDGELMLNLETGVQCLQATSPDTDHEVIESADGRWRALVTQSSERTVVGLEYMMGMTNSRNLQNGTYSGAWDVDGTRFYLTDGATIYRFDAMREGRMRENALSLPDTAPLEIAGVVDDAAYLYYPQGEDDLPGGIFVVNALTGAQMDHLQPDLSFAQVILANNRLYASLSQDSTTQLYSIDRENGAIMSEGLLQGNISEAAYGALNPELLGRTIAPVSLSNCPDDSSPFLAFSFPQN